VVEFAGSRGIGEEDVITIMSSVRRQVGINDANEHREVTDSASPYLGMSDRYALPIHPTRIIPSCSIGGMDEDGINQYRKEYAGYQDNGYE
jgi:hypothetical protein